MKRKRRVTLRSLDKIQFYTNIVLSVLAFWMIGILLRLNSIKENFSLYNLDGVDDVLPLINRSHLVYRFIWVFLILSVIIFVYTTFIRSRINSQIKTLQNLISTINYGIFLLFLFLIRPLMRIVSTVKKAYSSIGDLDFDIFTDLGGIIGDFNSISSFRLKSTVVFLLLSAVVSVILGVMLYRRIYKGEKSRSIEGEVDGLTKSVRRGSQKARESIGSQVEDFKESARKREEEREQARKEEAEEEKTEEISEEPVGPENIDEDFVEIPLDESPSEEMMDEQAGPEEFDEILDEKTSAEETPPVKEEEKFSKKKEEEPNKPINKKLFAIILIVGLLVLSLFMIVPRVLDSLKPDAVISTHQMEIEIELTGINGNGTASAILTGEPVIKEIKTGVNEDAIKQYLLEQEISISPSEDLENGDTITAVVKFEETDRFNLELDLDEIKRELEVSGLPELINSYEDFDSSVINKLDEDFKSRIEDDYSGSTENLQIQRLSSYEKVMDEKELKDHDSEISDYIFANVYKIRYDEYYSRSESETRYLLFKAFDFEESNGVYRYEIRRMAEEKKEDDILDSLQFDGFKKIASINPDEPMKEIEKEEPEEEEEEKESSKEKKESERLSQDRLEKIARDYENTTRYVDNIANLRSGPSVNTDLIKTFQSGTPVEVLYTEINDEIRVWCYVRIDTDEGFYEGWMSNRVIK